MAQANRTNRALSSITRRAGVTRVALLAFSSMSVSHAFAPQCHPSQRIRHKTPTVGSIASVTTIGIQVPQAQRSRLGMTLTEVSNFYQDFPMQAAVLTCGFKASVADGIAQVRSSATNSVELRRNAAYVLYGGIFVGFMCHMEYDCLFPYLFGTEHSVWTIAEKVLFDDFVSAPLMWLPPAYLIKALMYDYPLAEGLQKYVDDIRNNGLLWRYWSIWLPAQTISFSVIPDHMRIAFMATVSFFWFILFSTISSKSDNDDSCRGGAR